LIDVFFDYAVMIAACLGSDFGWDKQKNNVSYKLKSLLEMRKGDIIRK